MNIKLPPYITERNSKLNVIVSAEHKFDKKVKGVLVLELRPKFGSEMDVDQSTIECTSDIDGEVDLQLDFQKLFFSIIKKYSFKSAKEFQIKAMINDLESNKSCSTIRSIIMYKNEISISVISSEQSVKPGLPFSVKLKVTYKNNVPVEDRDDPVKLRMEFGLKYDEISDIPRNGIADFNFVVPLDVDADFVQLYAYYKGIKYNLKQIEATSSPTRNYLHISSANQSDLIVGQDLELEIASTENMNSLNVLIFARNKIISHEVLALHDVKFFKHNVKINDEMFPKSKIIIYYMRPENSEAIGDAITFNVRASIAKMDMQISKTEYKSGEIADIILLSPPNIKTYIHGTDERSSIVNSDNAITEERILDYVSSLDSRGTSIRDADSDVDLELKNIQMILENSDMIFMANKMVPFSYKSSQNQPLGWGSEEDFFNSMDFSSTEKREQICKF